MDKEIKLDNTEPRFLYYRNHLTEFLVGSISILILMIFYWFFQFQKYGMQPISHYRVEIFINVVFFILPLSFYFYRSWSNRAKTIQVYPDGLLITNHQEKTKIPFSHIEHVDYVGLSIFYIQTTIGEKFYFSSNIERVDYILEGLFLARPDLLSKKEYEKIRLTLVQFDHHQKRKEWFLKNKSLDIFNWTIVPMFFMGLAYIIQSKDVVIYHEGLYFFRLLMFSLLMVLITAFTFSILLKKLVFDKKVSNQMDQIGDKIRDLDYESVILRRSKVFQTLTICFVLASLLKMDLNLFSITKIRESVASFNLEKGRTIVIDNRYNCINCKYGLADGDFVVFGKGHIGQILAKEGDMVGETGVDKQGRSLSSENIHLVPNGHLAVRTPNGKDILFIKIDELIGKIQN